MPQDIATQIQALADRQAPMEELFALREDASLWEILEAVINDSSPLPWALGILREALVQWPLDPCWETLDVKEYLSPETILLTVQGLSKDQRDEIESRLLNAIRCMPGREGLEWKRGLRLGKRGPNTLQSRELITLRDSILTDWRPSLLSTEKLTFDSCTGPLELGAAMGPIAPDEYIVEPVIVLAPDIEVRYSALSLAGRPVQRIFSEGWAVTYYLPQDCEGWERDRLDPSGMDLEMPVIFGGLTNSADLSSLPLGAVTTISLSTLDHLPELIEVDGCLELFGVGGLETLPEDLRISPRLLSERCSKAWTRFPGYALKIELCRDFRFLPEGLEIPVGLCLENLPKLESLPANISCTGNLSIRGCPIRELPLITSEMEDLHLEALPLQSLPEGLRIRGNLCIENLRNLDRFPSDIQVGGNISLFRCPVKTLPNGLLAVGELRLRDMPSFVELPAGLRVGGALCLQGLPGLTCLPPDTEVKGELLIKECESFATMPRFPHVAELIYLRGLPALRKLPEGFSCPGDFHLEGLPNLSKLPDGLVVGGSLKLEALGILAFSNNMSMEKGLALIGLHQFVRWPEGLTQIHGDLWLEGLPGLAELPDGLIVEGTLTIRNCPALRRLPKDLRAEAVECTEALAQSAVAPLIHWRLNPDQQPEPTEDDPFAGMPSATSLQESISTLQTMLLSSSEFDIVGRFTPEGNYLISLFDGTGNWHPPRILGEFYSSAMGFRSIRHNFILAPRDMDSVYDLALMTMKEWGFRNRGGWFTTVPGPELLDQAMEAYLHEHQADDPSGFESPYIIHLTFWVKDFESGGTVLAFGNDELATPPPAIRIVPPMNSARWRA